MAGIVEIRSQRPLVLDDSNTLAAFAQIKHTLAQIPSLFPRHAALALFVDGPATLAFMVGRAINPNLHGTVHVANYVSGEKGYERAFTLPLRFHAETKTRVIILFCAANPIGFSPLALNEELRDIRARIRNAASRDSVKLVSYPNARPDDLLQALNKHHPAIVHFAGHGTHNGIVLRDESGEPRVVPRGGLAALFGVFADDVRLVVLNAAYGDEQVDAITETIDCAIGMPCPSGKRA
jgi:hypothetical protein